MDNQNTPSICSCALGDISGPTAAYLFMPGRFPQKYLAR